MGGVSEGDKEFLAGIGSRPSGDSKIKAEGDAMDFADKLIAKQEKVIALQTTAKAFGVAPIAEVKEEKVAVKEPETLQATIVTGAMNQSKEMVKEMREDKAIIDANLQKARASEDAAKTQFYQFQANLITGVQEDLKGALATLRDQASPQGIAQTIKAYKDVSHELGIVEPKTEAKTPVGVPYDIQLQINKIQNDHEMAMKKLDLEINRQTNEFSLRRLDQDEDRSLKRQEYEDKKKFLDTGLSGLQDLATSVASAIDLDLGGAPPSGKGAAVKEKGAAHEPEVEVTVAAFPCPTCGTMVLVEEGINFAVCPNQQCKTGFNVKDSGG